MVTHKSEVVLMAHLDHKLDALVADGWRIVSISPVANEYRALIVVARGAS